MNNAIKSAGRHDVKAAPYQAAANTGMLVGSIFGICAAAIDNGGTGVLVTQGTFLMPAASVLASDAWTEGQKLYWDDTNRRLTTTASTHKWVAVAEAAKAAGVTTGYATLNGVAV